MDICILVYFSLYVIIYSGRTNSLALSQLQPSPSNFKILTKNSEDESKFDENDSSKYVVKSKGDGLRYKFKKGSKCVGLKYDDTPIWTYDSQINGEKYPLEIFFNSHTNNVRIKTENRLYIYSYRSGTWDLIFETEVTSAPSNTYHLFTPLKRDLTVDPTSEYSSSKYFDFYGSSRFLAVLSTDFVRKLSDNHIEILTVDDKLRLQVNDLTHFFMTKFQNFTTYELVNFKMYCEVKYKKQVLWIDKRHRSKATYPDLINIYTDNDIICLDFSGRKFLTNQGRRFYRYSKFINDLYRTPSIKPSDEKTKNFYLTLKCDSGNSSENTTELKLEHNSPGVLKHEFKNGEKCVKISCGLIIWEHDPLTEGDNYPTELYSDYWGTRSIKIKFATRSYLYKYENDKWSLKTLSIDDSSSHRMDNESIELDGDKTMDNSGESTDLIPATEESTDITQANEESTELTQVNEESSPTVATNEVSGDINDENSGNESSKDGVDESPKTEDNGEQSASESSISPDSTESTSNETAESMPSKSTDVDLADKSTNSNSTDLSSGSLTNNEATSEDGDDTSLIESTVYP
ncbi:hypothetical protein MACK_001106 [Theileria orientalis]|uniref:Uncharacterized protein n=1 Tax=Theileria orientalis TaxID=68886 RepID=A0A976QUF0_THEOR|nr:hypothetical protein MACK_001106 [Theileria orientalis]